MIMSDSNHQSTLSQKQINSVINLYSNGHYQGAIDQIKILNKSYPNVPFLFNLIGACYKGLGQIEESAKMFQVAIDLKDDYAEAHKNLGIVFNDLKENKNAISSFQKSLSLDKNQPDVYNNLGTSFKKNNQLKDAIKYFEKAISLNPSFVEALNNLGVVFFEMARFHSAIEFYQKALDLDPGYTESHYNLGVAFIKLGKFEDAINSLKRALNLNPGYIEALNYLGISYLKINRFNSGIKYFKKAIKISSNYAHPHNNLGHLYSKLKLYDDAYKSYQDAYSISSDLDYILGNLLNAKLHLCIWNNIANLKENLRRGILSNKKIVTSFDLLTLIDDASLQKKVVKLTVLSDFPKINTLGDINQHPKHSKIRIGYFSADFREHPVSYLTAELYEVHNRDQFEIHAFSFGPDTKDEMNLRIKAGVDHFHNVRSMSHQEITMLARSLEIDIAVDLAGFTADSAINSFAMSAAPIQLSYIGYLGSMGAEYYDYLIADPVMIPKESQKYYVEKIVYLPSFQVNDSKDLPPDIVLTRKDVGLPDNGFVFCCFNNTYKMTPTTFDSWARILQAVEGSVLIIFANNDLSKANLTKEIKRRGVDSDRLIFGDSLSRPEYLARFRVADLFLDTQPYNAGTTASDALKMGLPMLTLKGEAYQARMGASIVSALNLPELITTSSEEYESLAIELATNPEKMKAIKDKLASNLSTAPLFDTKLFTKNLESAYTEMYERYHKGLEPDHIYVE